MRSTVTPAEPARPSESVAAIAGLIIAVRQMFFDQTDAAVTTWSVAPNPFFDGSNAGRLTLVPFGALGVFLYFVAREKRLTPKKQNY